MEFADPYALALLALTLPVAAALWWRRRGGYVVSSGAAFANATPALRLRLARLLPVLRLAAIALLAVAIARPRIGDANAVVPAEGIDIALSLDISSSMATSRFGRADTDRLTATKKVIRDFIAGRENDRIGFVVFQDDALALAPPTLDYAALDTIVAQTQTGILPDGTGIGVGLASALNMLRDSNAASRVVILLTDGEHNATSISPEEAADLALALRIRVYTIGVIGEGSFLRQSGVDEKLLQHIADETGGRYFSASNPQALADVYDEIGKLETSRVGREHFASYTEVAPWFAGAAALLLLLELVLRGTWLRRTPA
ncbi:MAG: VWA domain-containing protein [Tepidiformaceae bacterium]